MNPESKFSRRLLSKFPMEAHIQRIETTTGSGVPDINVVYAGVEMWIETKVQTPAGHVLLRPFQWAWINKRFRSGGVGYVIAQKYDSKNIIFWSFGAICVAQHGEYLRITTVPTEMSLDAASVKLLFAQ
jgi:hypothetical protein